MAGRGTRQGLAAKLCPDGVETPFVADKRFRVVRMRFFMDTDGIIAFNDKIKIEADGQVLFSGQSLPIAAIADPSDDASAESVAQGGAHCLKFDDPLEWSNEYPIKVTPSIGASQNLWVILEGLPTAESV